MLKSMLTLAFVVALVGGCAAAQNVDLTAKIPFAYETRGVSMPAGEYHLANVTLGVVRMSDAAAKNHVAFTIIPAGRNEPSWDGKGKIKFRRYGDRYFLEAIETPDGAVLAPHRTKLERELWANSRLKPEFVVVVAD